MRQITVFTQARNWLGLGRIFPRIRDHGYDITLIAQEGNILSRSSCVNHVVSIAPQQGDQAWIEAILSTAGSRLLIGDDIALDYLLRHSKSNDKIRSMVGTSLGEVEDLLLARNKLQLSEYAREMGIPVPRIIPLSPDIDAGVLLSGLAWPLVLKSGYGFAGNEVHICRNFRETRTALRALKLQSQAFAQEHIAGTSVMVALACNKGEVLNQFSVFKRACWPPERGPSTVVEIISIPEIEIYVNALVAKLKLSGLISFDFIRDIQDKYWLLECNLRPVPISHCDEFLIDAWIDNKAKIQPPPKNSLLALFPQSKLYPVQQELQDAATLDKPDNDPGLLRAMEELLPAPAPG